MSQNKTLTCINFFISSTFIDLKDYRKTIIEKIKSKKGQINAQEFFGSRSDSALETMLKELEKSDVVILILAHRYGSIDEESGKSFTQIEYEKAKELNKHIFAYIIENTYKFNPEYIDDKEKKEKLTAFKDLVRNPRNGLTVSTFTSEEDLANKVILDLTRELPKYEFILGGEQKENLGQNYIKQLCEFPNFMNGREISIEIELLDWCAATKSECEAFNLTFGSSIKRKFKVINNEYSNLLESKYKHIYASNEKAIELSELENAKYTTTLKISFGHYTKVIQQQKEVTNYLNVFSNNIITWDKEVEETIQGLIYIGIQK